MDSQMTSVFTLTNTFTVNWCILLFFLQNAFVQLSLAFRNDNYTLESRLKQTERERTLTEENTEKELEEFKSSLKVRPECKQPTQTHMLGINWNVTNCCWRPISEHCVTVAERRAAGVLPATLRNDRRVAPPDQPPLQPGWNAGSREAGEMLITCQPLNVRSH